MDAVSFTPFALSGIFVSIYFYGFLSGIRSLARLRSTLSLPIFQLSGSAAPGYNPFIGKFPEK
jgi:hypothetical protein